MNEKEVYICPIMMRTVILIDGKCTEDCDEDDCPLAVAIEKKMKEDLLIILQSTTYEGVMGQKKESLDKDGCPAPLYTGETFYKGICDLFALVLFEEFGYQPLKTKGSDSHYFCTDGKRFIDARGWTELMDDPLRGGIITKYEPMDIENERNEIRENNCFQYEGYEFAKKFVKQNRQYYINPHLHTGD